MKEKKNKSGKLNKAVVLILGIVITALVLYPFVACLVYPPAYVYRALTWGKEGV
jgi:hypothetical protein